MIRRLIAWLYVKYVMKPTANEMFGPQGLDIMDLEEYEIEIDLDD